jgi:predicted ATPase
VYHFHDTSSTADVRQSCYKGDKRWLMPDAGNLAAVLLRFREENSSLAYQHIIGTIQSVLIAHRRKKGHIHRGGDRNYEPRHNFDEL